MFPEPSFRIAWYIFFSGMPAEVVIWFFCFYDATEIIVTYHDQQGLEDVKISSIPAFYPPLLLLRGLCSQPEQLVDDFCISIFFPEHLQGGKLFFSVMLGLFFYRVSNGNLFLLKMEFL